MKERKFILPDEILVKEDSSNNDALRESLFMNLDQKLQTPKSNDSNAGIA